MTDILDNDTRPLAAVRREFAAARSVLVAALALALVSCASRPMAIPAATGSWPLLAPATLGAPRTATQRLRAMHGNREISIECAVDVDDARILLIGLLPAGPRLFTVTYDGRQVDAQASRSLPAVLSPQRMLNDLQLVYWPLAALEQALSPTAWRVTEPDPRTRRLLRDGALVAEVHYAGADRWRGRAWLASFADDYSIAIDSASVD